MINTGGCITYQRAVFGIFCPVKPKCLYCILRCKGHAIGDLLLYIIFKM